MAPAADRPERAVDSGAIQSKMSERILRSLGTHRTNNRLVFHTILPMHLSEVSIENFRNLQRVTLYLQPGLNVVVGPNNSGKTNLFDAIRHALGHLSSRSEPLWLDEQDLHRSSDQICTSEPIYVGLTFCGLTDDERAQYFEIIHFGPAFAIEDAPARLNFEASWNETTRRFRVSRWGGARDGERTAVPAEIIEALPLVFLPALRDADAALTPGNRSILARVFQDIAARNPGDHKERLETVFAEANRQLEQDDLVKQVEGRLRQGVQRMAGTEYTSTSVRASEPDFSRILRTLKLILDKSPVPDLERSGLGYSNLLYIAAILTHLENPLGPECPVLLIEEPEAHLSPQYTVLLGEFLSTLAVPQVLVSTHSPTFASNVSPSRMVILGRVETGGTASRSLSRIGLTALEERQLQRMLDITRATLYFARGLILVEGISEALLVPELAKLLGRNLSQHHISVLPICGVGFATFVKLFSPDAIDIPVAIVTDADPPVDRDESGRWQSDTPQIGKKSSRLSRIEELFAGNPRVRICAANVTLEYDLAAAGDENPTLMTRAWEASFVGTPQTLNQAALRGVADLRERALCVWRGICRASHSGSKGDFANLLAASLAEDAGTSAFVVPEYIAIAIEHVLPPMSSSPPEE